MRQITLALLGVTSLSPAYADGPDSAPTHRSPTQVQIDDVLRRLREAQGLARGPNPLPFKLSCLDEQESGACEGGGRKALATLPLEKATHAEPIYNVSCVRTVFEYPGDVCPRSVIGQSPKIDGWRIVLPHAGGGAYSWTVGLAPAGSVEAIELERGMIFWH
jgi:hypothetical protein